MRASLLSVQYNIMQYNGDDDDDDNEIIYIVPVPKSQWRLTVS